MIRKIAVNSEEANLLLEQAAEALARNKNLRHAPTGKLPARLQQEIQAALLESGVVSVGPFSFGEEDLSPTPTQEVPEGFAGAVGLAAQTLGMMAQSVGSLLTYNDIKQAGVLVQNIFPAEGREKEESAASSEADLSWHTEHARKDSPPDFLAIFCLRNPTGTGTRLASFSLKNLDETTLQALRNPKATRFYCRGGKAEQPVVNEDDHGPRVRFDPVFQEPANVAVRNGLNKLMAQVQESAFEAPQIPGHILIFSNRRFTHARDAFTANFDGKDRWLLRSMISR